MTWHPLGSDPSGYGNGICQQRFDAAGTAVGGEIDVNERTSDDQQIPTVTALNDGGWVVTWTSRNGSSYDVLQQRYDTRGAALGYETRVNTTIYSNGYNRASVVTALADGGRVVAWEGIPGSGSIYQQRYDADGDRVGGETLVNTYGPSEQIHTLTTGADAVSADAGPSRVMAAPSTLTSLDDLDGGDGYDTIEMSTAGTLDLTAPSALPGYEALLGTSGDDTFVFDADRSATFTLFDGGAGHDALRIVGGGSVSFEGRSFSGIEEIRLDDAGGTSIRVGDAATALLADARNGVADAVEIAGDLSPEALVGLVARGFERIAFVREGAAQVVTVGADEIVPMVDDVAETRVWRSIEARYDPDFSPTSLVVEKDDGWRITTTHVDGQRASTRFVDAGDTNAVFMEYTDFYTDGVRTRRSGLQPIGSPRERQHLGDDLCGRCADVDADGRRERRRVPFRKDVILRRRRHDRRRLGSDLRRRIAPRPLPCRRPDPGGVDRRRPFGGRHRIGRPRPHGDRRPGRRHGIRERHRSSRSASVSFRELLRSGGAGSSLWNGDDEARMGDRFLDPPARPLLRRLRCVRRAPPTDVRARSNGCRLRRAFARSAMWCGASTRSRRQPSRGTHEAPHEPTSPPRDPACLRAMWPRRAGCTFAAEGRGGDASAPRRSRRRLNQRTRISVAAPRGTFRRLAMVHFASHIGPWGSRGGVS